MLDDGRTLSGHVVSVGESSLLRTFHPVTSGRPVFFGGCGVPARAVHRSRRWSPLPVTGGHEVLHHAKHRKRASSNRLYEDEITSSVFGPIAFMPTAEAWALVRSAFRVSGSPAGFSPDSHYVEFWPTLRVEGQIVEPDLVFSFRDGRSGEGLKATVFRLLVEVKWDAPASNRAAVGPGDQLARQWKAMASELGDAAVVMRYLVRHTAGAQEEIDGCQRRLRSANLELELVSWHELAGNSVRRPAGALSMMWGDLVESLLRRLGVVPFSGFRDFEAVDAHSVLTWSVGPRLDWRLPLSTAMQSADVFAWRIRCE